MFEIPKTQIYLGDCPVGVEKSSFVQVTNICELPVDITVQYESQSIRFRKKVFHIPARQTIDLMFDFMPHKINPDYRKQVTFVNVKNPENYHFVLLKANIVANKTSNNVEQYRILTGAAPNNQLEFDKMIMNCPSVRTFTIKNVSTKAFKVNLSCLDPDEIQLYYENPFPVLNSVANTEAGISKHQKSTEQHVATKLTVSDSASNSPAKGFET